MDIQTTVIFDELMAASRREEVKYFILEGSSRSSKTYSILQFLVYVGLSKQVRVTIGRLRLTWLKSTLIPDFYDVLRSFSVFNINWMNKTEGTYSLPNGTVFTFLGLEEPERLQGSKQDYCYIDEILESPKRAYEMLDARTTTLFIGSYNPSASKHWVYDTLADVKSPEVWYHHSTYKLNPFLTPRNIAAIEKWDPSNPANEDTQDDYLWSVFGEGKRMAPTGLIFRYNVIRDDEIPEDAYNVAYGLDLGFSNDESALVYKAEKDGTLFLREELYEVGLTTLINPGNPSQESLESEFIKRDIDKRIPMYIDNSRPETIRDLQNAGWMAQACKKFPGSVDYTINVIKEYKICVTEGSINLMHELNAYRRDENGKIKGVDHLCDSVRYSVTGCRLSTCGKEIDSCKPNTGAEKYDYSTDDDDDWADETF